MDRNRDRSRGFRIAMLRTRAELEVFVLVAVAVVLVLVLAGAVPAAASAQQSATVATSLVFDNVTVIDVEHGKLLPAQWVVITGNRIQAVGSGRAVPVPKGAQVVDAKGKYLIPGLWDMHTHSRYLAHLFYPLFIANGVTGIRDAWSETPLDTLLQWRREILAGTRVGPPRQLLAGPPLDQLDSADAERTVDSLKAAGADFLKTYPLGYAVAAAARRRGIPFGGHIPESITAIEASDSGASIIDHSYAVSTPCLNGPSASIEECQLVAERFRRNGTWWVPTWIRPPLGGGERSQRVAARFDELMLEFWADSVLNPYSPDRTGRSATHVEMPDASRRNSTADSHGYMYIAQRVGLPILAGTDAGAPVFKTTPPGFSLHTELAMYVAEGLTPLEALQAATLSPARLLHATDSLGTVAAGKLADLVLLDANPLADITNTTTIRAVVANGRYFDRTTLDRLLAEVQVKAKAELKPEP